MDIATGTPENHPTPLPLDASHSPGVAPPTPIQPGQLAGPTYDARDTTGEFQSLMAQQIADATAAMHTGMDARNAMLAHYQSQVMPLGGQAGDDLVLPVVPDNALVPASSDQYPWPGDEPTPSSAGPTYQGSVPT